MQWSAPGYTEIRQLGRGGSGRVALGAHDATGIRVAIKYLSEELRHDGAALARFQSEARLLVTLRDPNIATMWEYIQDAFGACIVMELVNGVSLRALMREHGPAGPEAALAVLKGSLLGLAKAHELGLVHRDYKPENVLVRDDGVSKLVDFGIAVRHGTVARPEGTPPYMAPELWAGLPATPATDVYAATVVFFECLTGHRPYRSTEPSVLGYQHVHAPVPIHEAPAPVRELVRRGLAKDPAARPGSAPAFVGELESAARAAYGEDWEERGRRRLSGLVALLALLLPEPAPPMPETSTSLARTVFHDLRSMARRVGRSKAATGADGPDAVGAARADAPAVATAATGPDVRRPAGSNVRRMATGGALATVAAVTAVIVLVSSRPVPEQPIGAAAAVPPSRTPTEPVSAPPGTPGPNTDPGNTPAGSPQAAIPLDTGPPGSPETSGPDRDPVDDAANPDTPPDPDPADPGNPDPADPGNPDLDEPADPDPGQPGDPDTGNPGNPGNPDPGQPGNPDPGEPGNPSDPDPGEPGGPDPDPGAPGDPGPGDPGPGDPGNPGEPGPGEPGNPGTGDPPPGEEPPSGTPVLAADVGAITVNARGVASATVTLRTGDAGPVTATATWRAAGTGGHTQRVPLRGSTRYTRTLTWAMGERPCGRTVTLTFTTAPASPGGPARASLSVPPCPARVTGLDVRLALPETPRRAAAVTATTAPATATATATATIRVTTSGTGEIPVRAWFAVGDNPAGTRDTTLSGRRSYTKRFAFPLRSRPCGSWLSVRVSAGSRTDTARTRVVCPPQVRRVAIVEAAAGRGVSAQVRVTAADTRPVRLTVRFAAGRRVDTRTVTLSGETSYSMALSSPLRLTCGTRWSVTALTTPAAANGPDRRTGATPACPDTPREPKPDENSPERDETTPKPSEGTPTPTRNAPTPSESAPAPGRNPAQDSPDPDEGGPEPPENS